MVVLVVATTSDAASATPAAAFLAMPGWTPGPSIPVRMPRPRPRHRLLPCLTLRAAGAGRRGELRERRGGAAAAARARDRGGGRPGPAVGGRHGGARLRGGPPQPPHRRLQPTRAHRPPHRRPHLRDGVDVRRRAGARWAAPPNPRIGPWLRLLRRIAADRGLVPEFEVITLLVFFFNFAFLISFLELGIAVVCIG